jgi:F-type H+-transporting ATPase subunit delta
MSLSKKAVATYAKSLFQNVNSSKVSDGTFEVSKITSSDKNTFVPDVYIIGEELLLIRSVLTSSKKMAAFFANPTYGEQQKFEVINNIFPGLTTTTKSFLKVLTERSHLSLIPEVSDEYNRFLLKFKKVTNVKLIVASLLKENSGSLLLSTLKELTGSNEIILNLSYNPKLLGGLVLEYNSSAIDASILKEFSLFFNDI